MASFPHISPPKPCLHLSSPPYLPRVPLIVLFFILSPNSAWWGVRTMALIALYPPLSPFLVSLSLIYLLQHRHTLSLYPFLNLGDQVSHPYGTLGRPVVLYILSLYYLQQHRDKLRCTWRQQQAFPRSILLLIYLRTQFWYIRVVPECVTFARLFKG